MATTDPETLTRLEKIEALLQNYEYRFEEQGHRIEEQGQEIADLKRENADLKRENKRKDQVIEKLVERIEKLEVTEAYAKVIFDQIIEERSITTRGEFADSVLNAIARDLMKLLKIESDKPLGIHQLKKHLNFPQVLTIEERHELDMLLNVLYELKKERNQQNHAIEERERIRKQEIENVFEATWAVCNKFRTLLATKLTSLMAINLRRVLTSRGNLNRNGKKKTTFKTVDSPPKTETNGMPLASYSTPVKSPALTA